MTCLLYTSDIYVDGYRRMVGDENFTPAELAAIAAGYARSRDMEMFLRV